MLERQVGGSMTEPMGGRLIHRAGRCVALEEQHASSQCAYSFRKMSVEVLGGDLPSAEHANLTVA